jgi:hypothetical protein
MSSDPEKNFKCLCYDCPKCHNERIFRIAHNRYKTGVNDPKVENLECAACAHVWNLRISEMPLRTKTKTEIDTKFGGAESYEYYP